MTDETLECEILSHEIEKVKFCCEDSQRVLFFFLSMEGGGRIRQAFNMCEGDDEYFDPSSTGKVSLYRECSGLENWDIYLIIMELLVILCTL